MSLSVQVHRLPIENGQNLWVWHLFDVESFAQYTEKDLLEQGWELVEPNKLSFPIVAVLSQVANTLPLMTVGQTIVKSWVHSDDLAAAAAHPVILAFSHQQQGFEGIEQHTLLPTSPQLGEVGVILEDKQYFIYRLKALEEKGKVWYRRLKQALDEVLSSESTYPSRDASWRTAQHAAQRLAELYWDVHVQAHHQSVSEVAGQRTIVPSLEGEARKNTRRRLPAADLVRRDEEAVEVTSDAISQALWLGLLSKDLYTLYPKQALARYQKLLTPEQREIRIEIRPSLGEVWEDVMRSLEQLGDGVVDVFCAVLALAFDNPEHDFTHAFFLNVDDILKVMQKKQSNRSYTPEQRSQTIESLMLLRRVHIIFERPGNLMEPLQGERAPRGRRKKRDQVPEGIEVTDFLDSVLLDLLGSVIGQYETITGEILWQSRQVRLGPWVEYIHIGAETIPLLRIILAYHQKKGYVAKRAGRWFTAQFHTHKPQPRAVEIRIETLLQHLALSPVRTTRVYKKERGPKNPARTHKMLMDAFALLRSDGVIGAYGRVSAPPPEGETEDERIARLLREEQDDLCVKQLAQGWWYLFVQQTWRFEPPAPRPGQVRTQAFQSLPSPDEEE